MKLFLNCLIKWTGSGEVERVLCHHPSGAGYYCIAVNGSKAWPVFRERGALEASLEKRQVAVLDKDDLVLNLRMDNALTPAQRTNRDAAWAVIKGLVEDPAKLVYDRRTSGKEIRLAAQEHGVHVTSVYKYLRRFWQKGQTIEALQPDLHKCGGPNKTRIPGTKKLGDVNSDGVHVGINVTDAVRDHFEDAINKYYHTEQRLPFTMVYDKMLADHYTVGYEMKNGAPSPVLAPKELRPTFAQFRYYYDKNHRKVKSLKDRVGGIYYQQNCQEVTTVQTQVALGIGDIYQIDSTTADVYLVHSKKTDMVVGRPVVYLVIDVFSELVVGVYVTFFNASYNAASMAVWNAFSDKVSFCASVGIKLDDPLHWPSRGLPHSYLADRGELLSRKSDRIGERLGIVMDTAQAYSPRVKAIVERHFRLRNDELIRWLPGAVPDEEFKRGKADHRKKASLTKEEFTEALVRSILAYNVSILPNYQRSAAMIADNVEPRPYKIWDWALEHANKLRDMDPLMVRLGLLPTESGTVTEKGIRFNSLFYTCARARLEEWFSASNAFNNTWQVACSYDPGLVDHIYMLGKTPAETEVCELQPFCGDFAGWTWQEVDRYREAERAMINAGKKEDEATRISAQVQVQRIVQAAVERRKDNGPADVKHLAEMQQDQQIQEAQASAKELHAMMGVAPLQPSAPPAVPSVTKNDPSGHSKTEERFLKIWEQKKKAKQQGTTSE